MRKDSDSEARTAAAARGRGLPVWVESAGG